MDEQAFWQWALTRWRLPEVEARLLSLQDQHQLVVLEVLFVAWLGGRGVPLSEQQWQRLVAAADPWVNDVVIPLRQRRAAWKTATMDEGLRDRLKKLELAAERELAAIYGAALDLDSVALNSTVLSGAEGSSPDPKALIANLALCLSRAEPALSSAVIAEIAELLPPSPV